MANILDYIAWRGDLTFAQDPFNEVDNLILSELCFFDFNEVMESEDILNLGSAARHFFEKYPKETHRLGLLFSQSFEELLDKASRCRRFGNTLITHPVSIITEEPAMQFSATTFILEDGSVFVAFRGTDDYIVAWKESFSLCIQDEIPGQSAALAYLKQALSHTDAPIRVGGHSKGGNLALYATLNLNDAERKRIIGVYCNDSPGFRQDPRNTPAFRSIADRYIGITPHLSVVGAVLEHGIDSEILESDGKGVFQHDAFNWHLQGNRFIRLPDRSEESKQFEDTVHSWLAKLNDAEKRDFLETLYKLLTSSGARTLSELKEDRLRSAYTMAGTLFSLEKPVRDLLIRCLGALFREYRSVNKARKIEAKIEGAAKRKLLSSEEYTANLDRELAEMMAEEPKKPKSHKKRTPKKPKKKPAKQVTNKKSKP